MSMGNNARAILFAEDVSRKTHPDTVGEVGKNVRWKLELPPKLDLTDYLQLKSMLGVSVGLKQVMPALEGGDSCIFYAATPGNLYSAVKRQCIEVTQPDPLMEKQFFEWYSLIFDEEIVPLLEKFEYSFEVWYNHLTRGQQNELTEALVLKEEDPLALKKRQYSMFCKREKQIVDDPSKNPKNRCICAPNPEYKIVMGPVVYALDLIFRKFKGYCQGKNWEEMETELNAMRERNQIKVVEGDGSGFDRTQTHSLKDVERRVYRWLASHDKIHHVPTSVFLHHVNIEWRPIKVEHLDKVRDQIVRHRMGNVSIRGTVFSGDCDTTFGNTLRMALYNRYTVEAILGIHRESYTIFAKGDDFAVALEPTVEDIDIKKAYYTTFSPKKTGVHGLGQILKFLKIGRIDTMDFCSTETFWCSGCKSHKIIRQLSRFVALNPWSHTVLAFSQDQEDEYMETLYQANLCWMDGLPIFSQLNEFLHRTGFKPSKPRRGFERLYLPVPEKYRHLIRGPDRLEKLLTMSKEDYWGMVDRVSRKRECCSKSFLQHLEKFYGMSVGEVERCCNNIQRTSRTATTVDLPELLLAFRTKKEHGMDLFHFA